MKEMARKTLMIYRRLPDGWSEKIANEDPERCDLDGEKLWIDPGGQVYCDAVHVASNETRAGVVLTKGKYRNAA